MYFDGAHKVADNQRDAFAYVVAKPDARLERRSDSGAVIVVIDFNGVMTSMGFDAAHDQGWGKLYKQWLFDSGKIAKPYEEYEAS